MNGKEMVKVNFSNNGVEILFPITMASIN